ncbi:adenosylhomocysteinase [bacterium]|nr:adenosylhomocysteinase [bacterium]
MEYSIKDISLAETGRKRVEWAFKEMNVLNLIKSRYSNSKPLKGIRVGCCLHITTETANLMTTLKSSGAEVYLCASNPLSTQDDVSAHLVKNENIGVFGKRGEDNKSYYENINNIMKKEPHIVVDDGCDLISSLHKNPSYATNIIGATEETTTGVVRLKNLASNNLLKFPVIAVNDANTKHLFDNRYGTGQSTIDGVLRATNILISGKIAVVAGYGWCGKGIAKRFEGMGAKVIVTETDPIKALEAAMDGYWVMPISEASEKGDIFITSTGNTSVITINEILKMKSGAILGNAGHFNVEIDLTELEKSTIKKTNIRQGLDEYSLNNGRNVYILGEGRLVNLACAEGHPSAVMDLSFANQFLSVKYIRENNPLEPKVYNVPQEIDIEVARLKLESMGIKIDTLTKQQKEYINSWNLGT